MPNIRFEGNDFHCMADESVLACMTRHGVLIPSSCQAGICQTCMIRALEGQPTSESQEGLKDTLKAQNYFLACMCKPEADLTIGLSTISSCYSTALMSKDLLNDTVVRLRLQLPGDFSYQAGQFINLMRVHDQLTRSYSLASVPGDDFLELQVKRVPDGQMSNWLFDALKVGDSLEFFGPAGDCFYLPGNTDQPLLLVGTGTGLAPLYGILRDALALGHAGPIHLFHASLAAAGLYLEQALRAIEGQYDQFHYMPCVLHGDVPVGGRQGDITELPAQVLGSLSNYRVFLCGDPPIVNALKRQCFMAGASMQDIHADPFVFVTPPDGA